jgi:hypothetical protein
VEVVTILAVLVLADMDSLAELTIRQDGILLAVAAVLVP